MRPPHPLSTLFPYTTLFRSSLHTCTPRLRYDVPRRARSLGTRSRDNRRRHCRGIESQASRSEEHTSELQSRLHLVCRLLPDKKKHTMQNRTTVTEAPITRCD